MRGYGVSKSAAAFQKEICPCCREGQNRPKERKSARRQGKKQTVTDEDITEEQVIDDFHALRFKDT